MITIYICDDEPQIVKQLKNLIEQSDNSFDIKVFYSAEEVLDSIHKEVQIVFLDIQMKKINGIDTAKVLKERFSHIIIIFISSYFQFISEAFSLNAFQFLLKPINEAEFTKEFRRALDTYYRNHYKYRICYKENIFLMDVQDIISIETHGRHLLLKTTENTYEYVGKIKDEILKLEAYNFIKTHQSYIVNMAHIAGYTKNSFILNDKTLIPISKHLKNEVMEKFTKYIAGIVI